MKTQIEGPEARAAETPSMSRRSRCGLQDVTGFCSAGASSLIFRRLPQSATLPFSCSLSLTPTQIIIPALIHLRTAPHILKYIGHHCTVPNRTMKLLTKQEEDAHYRSVVKGGTIGGILGLIGGVAGVLAFSKRSSTVRNLTLPMKSFLVTSSGTFVGIVAADHASRDFEASRNASQMWYQNRTERLRQEELAQLSTVDRLTAWAKREKYKIVGATWVASMVGSFAMVSRNKFLSSSQKIVQARVYAQGLTLAVLVASAAFEIHDQRKGKGILDKAKAEKEEAQKQNSQELASHEETGDLWKDMVAAEEERLKRKKQSLYEHDYQEGHAKDGEKKQEQQQQEQQQGKKEPEAEKKE
ncbi:HIG1 domain-containing protein [Aspergillus homomorphus CBS 101889]|uniref:HIG1 domain-containing protein n=1 Tax=Aspergillus homomorphus (strain CBS 101889) TaxID=1450537 RepID=A0A395I9K1_ASPHC|nr:hypothetical protein BO97DRAFT_410355 [Aspergillus homomorphus CBS 101889]RAL16837.1 hypothetical protein BO97DRAFT_410355 [Aspergillus homomorphus CBS 101889]